MPIIAGVPLLICLLFSGATHLIWWRRREASHAQMWSFAFLIIAIGWGLDVLALAVSDATTQPGVGPGLCWLAAALLFVHGLRQRAGRTDRSVVLIAIWAVIAIATGLLADLFAMRPMLLQSGAPLLITVGLGCAAIAVGPRQHRSAPLEWIACGLLMSFAVCNVVLDGLWVMGHAGLVGIAMPLASAIVYAGLGVAAMLLLSQDLAIALERLARTDPLTNVWNRRAFNEAAPHLLDKLRRSTGPILAGVCIADIDAFKSINDRFGHATGDQVLISFCRMLEAALKPGDLLARLGGEEFAILAVGVSGAALYERIEQLRQIISVKSDAEGTLPLITASFGVAEIAATTLDLRDALERADRALFRAKEMGRNRAVLDHMPSQPDPVSPAERGKWTSPRSTGTPYDDGRDDRR